MELKKCPFCGDVHVGITRKFSITKPNNYFVKCSKCGARASNAECKEEASGLWNRVKFRDTKVVYTPKESEELTKENEELRTGIDSLSRRVKELEDTNNKLVCYKIYYLMDKSLKKELGAYEDEELDLLMRGRVWY